MAWTARQGEDLVEHIESEKELDAHCKELARLIGDARHMVAYTGAGISCSAGIPDFRVGFVFWFRRRSAFSAFRLRCLPPSHTPSHQGPKGVWTLAAEGKQVENAQPTISAIPTLGHMSLVALQDRGILKHLISSNCDGLHVKSGILPDRITEVHGNSNLEECSDCERKYYRDFPTHVKLSRGLTEKIQLKGRAEKHFTGRFCVCGGTLCDSIINFGENLSEKAIEDGFLHGGKADLMVAMGASLTVSPSCDMVAAVKRRGRGKLVIINLQKTPYDEMCDLRIFAKTDDVWQRVMSYLNIPVPPFTLQRRLCVWSSDEGGAHSVKLLGLTADGTPATWVKAAASAEGTQLVGKYAETYARKIFLL
jgi:NAD-dependent SIR2 family protein deacetylase